jgi:hypothetical protein
MGRSIISLAMVFIRCKLSTPPLAANETLYELLLLLLLLLPLSPSHMIHHIISSNHNTAKKRQLRLQVLKQKHNHSPLKRSIGDGNIEPSYPSII